MCEVCSVISEIKWVLVVVVVCKTMSMGCPRNGPFWSGRLELARKDIQNEKHTKKK